MLKVALFGGYRVTFGTPYLQFGMSKSSKLYMYSYLRQICKVLTSLLLKILSHLLTYGHRKIIGPTARSLRDFFMCVSARFFTSRSINLFVSI